MMHLFHSLLTAMISFLILCCSVPCLAQNDQATLLEKVTELPLPDSGSFYALSHIISEQPSISAVADMGDGIHVKLPAMLTTRLGKGKILVLGSDFYIREGLQDARVQQFWLNVTTWAGKAKGKRIRVGCFGDKSAVQSVWPKANSYLAKKVIKRKTDMFLLERDVSSAQRAVLEDYVRSGGVLIFVSPYPAIHQTNPNQQADALQINQLFVKAGIFHGSTLFKSSAANHQLILDTVPDYLHFNRFFDELASGAIRIKPNDYDDYYKNIMVTNLTTDFIFKYHALDAPLMKKLKAKFQVPDVISVPSQQKPIDISNDQKRYRYLFAAKWFEKQDSLLYRQLVSSASMGEIPKGAALVEKDINIPVQVGNQGLMEPSSVYHRPHSTGLYAVPGSRIKITLKKPLLSEGLKMQVGVHRDDLMHMDQLVRTGYDLTQLVDLKTVETTVQVKYGGLLELCIPDTCSLQSIELLIAGAIEAPYFKLDEHTDAEWIKRRKAPAPWTELASNKIVLTVPSDRIRTLNSPTKLLRFWDKVLDADAELAHINKERAYPERIIVDPQVAFGYMFTSPEKIVVPADGSCDLLLNADSLRLYGSWGHFHELGHRHQFWDIDFDGLSEVTVNLFTMYVYDNLLNKGLYNHEAITDVRKRVKAYFLQDKPLSFESLKEDPFTALCPYIQLIEKFGWQPVRDVYAYFRTLSPHQYPKTDQEKVDLWFTAICRATETNLSQFFDIWRIPVSSKAKMRAGNYKCWIPAELVYLDYQRSLLERLQRYTSPIQ